MQKMTLKVYQNLGKLFYAIAAADNEVRKVEFDKLKELVRKHWLELDPIEDIYSTDAAYQIEIVFDWLNQEQNLNTKACFDDFINYNFNNYIIKEFDYIIGNPPFNCNGMKKVHTNNNVKKKNDGKTIWIDFLKKSISILKKE